LFELVEADGTLAVAPDTEPEADPSGGPIQGQIFTRAGAPSHLVDEETFASSVPREVLHRRYSSDVLWSFLFPTALGNMLMFLGLWAVFCFAQAAASPMRFIYFICWFILFGWYAAYRFDILESAAAGDEDLPSPMATRDLAADLVAPLLGWIGSWLVVMIPAGLYIAYLVDKGTLGVPDIGNILMGGLRGVLGGSTWGHPVLTTFIVLGLVAWPMVVLCIAVGGFPTLYRLDLILKTVVQTMPGYVTTILLVALTLGLETVAHVGGLPWAAPRWRPPGAPVPVAAGFSMKWFVLSVGLHVYMDIVRMRLIGLYYYHNKRNFAWSWE
jgi:hypothetical protein